MADHHCQCPKLESFETYQDCGYRKAAATCNNPTDLPSCPVPSLPLRKGDLNQLAFSLYFFLRDRCGGDLVGFIDGLFAEADATQPEDPVAAKREALIRAISKVHAVSTKLIAMTFAPLLMAGDPRRKDWIKVGRSLVAIDSLVHNFLHRTGILGAFDRPHAYGIRCYRSDGCTGVVDELAARIDASRINPRFPKTFPRMVQFAIWSFCAEGHADICNGRQIDDRVPCTRLDCPVGSTCARVPLRPTPSKTLGRGYAVRSRQPRSPLRPFRQGHLDGLCGIYALINAIRLATADHLHLSNDEWTELFVHLLAKADRRTGVDLVTAGIGTSRLLSLARHAIDHLADDYGIELTISRPLIDLRRTSPRKLITKLRPLVRHPASALVIRLNGSFDHWSVLRSVDDRRLNLFDSSGIRRIRVDRCRTHRAAKLGEGLVYVLHQHSIVRLRMEA